MDEDVKEVPPPIVAPEPAVKKKRTRAEIAASAERKRQEKVAAAIKKIEEREEKAKERREKAKTKRVAERTMARNTFKNKFLREAHALRRSNNNETGYSFTEEDLKLPSRGVKEEKMGNYLRAAKARYYKRTKKNDSLTRQAKRIAAEQPNLGINPALIKRTRTAMTVNAMLAAARKKSAKSKGKSERVTQRDDIAKDIMEKFNLPNLKEVQKVMCYLTTEERKERRKKD